MAAGRGPGKPVWKPCLRPVRPRSGRDGGIGGGAKLRPSRFCMSKNSSDGGGWWSNRALRLRWGSACGGAEAARAVGAHARQDEGAAGAERPEHGRAGGSGSRRRSWPRRRPSGSVQRCAWDWSREMSVRDVGPGYAGRIRQGDARRRSRRCVVSALPKRGMKRRFSRGSGAEAQGCRQDGPGERTMPAKIDTRDEALRCAREAAHVVLAKHPCVTGADAKRTGKTGGSAGSSLSCDQVLAAYERQDVGRGPIAAGDGSS